MRRALKHDAAMSARLIAGALSVVLACQSAAAAERFPIERLDDGGHAVMLRHALAPGVGDPQNFRLGDCATQRNLSEEGRAQARRLGERLRAHGIDEAEVYSSQWCRCDGTGQPPVVGTIGPHSSPPR